MTINASPHGAYHAHACNGRDKRLMVDGRGSVHNRFVVVSCPDGTYRPGALFCRTDIVQGLTQDNWPEGMVFRFHRVTMVVKGKKLIMEEV